VARVAGTRVDLKNRGGPAIVKEAGTVSWPAVDPSARNRHVAYNHDAFIWRFRVKTMRRIAGRVLLPAGIMLVAAGCAGADGEDVADLVLRNGRLVTVDDAVPEAQALAVRGDRIVAVGTNEEVEAFIGRRTEVVDLGGRLAIPGFIEGHGHWMNLGRAKMNLDLMQARNWDDIVSLVAAAVAMRRRMRGSRVGAGIRRSGTSRGRTRWRACRSMRR
jgi:hypothetical protein